MDEPSGASSMSFCNPDYLVRRRRLLEGMQITQIALDPCIFTVLTTYIIIAPIPLIIDVVRASISSTADMLFSTALAACRTTRRNEAALRRAVGTVAGTTSIAIGA